VERSPLDSGSSAELAWRDDLTGAWNRRYLRRLLLEEWPGLTAADATFSLLVLDLDGFKTVNDSFGHAAGDKVLRWAADELRRGFREGDRLIRYGGDEFVVALPDVGPEEARALAERARAGFDSVTLTDAATGAPVTLPISFSIGVASFPDDGRWGEEVLAVADRRLYEEKRQRRAATAAPVAGRARWVIAALLAIATGGLAATLAWREMRRPPEPPAAALASPADLAPSTDLVPNQIVVRDEEELAALRAEVERLRAALESERAGNERDRFAGRIQELEAQLARADREAVVTPVEAPGSDVDAASGLRVGERRSREELVLDSPAAPEPAAPAAPPVAPGAAPPGAPAEAATAAVVVPPRLLQAPRLAYPPLARSMRRAATIELLLTVDASGAVIAAVPTGPPAGLGFDDAARQAGLSAKFAPGTRDGVPVEMQTRLTIRFQRD
jgi:TonB family protein